MHRVMATTISRTTSAVTYFFGYMAFHSSPAKLCARLRSNSRMNTSATPILDLLSSSWYCVR